jgi:hypothetical protein
MKRSLFAVFAAIAALAWPGAAQPATIGATAAPSLRVSSLTPLVVHGAHFRPSERVKVMLVGVAVKRTKADAQGRFVARFRVGVDVCDGYSLRAAGSKGSKAALRALPRECASRNPG